MNRDLGTETLRGVAILLMTAGHVIGHDANAGMQVADDSAWRHLYVSLEFLRMPLFTVISGYVYAIRPIEKGAIGRFTRRKVRRLLVPMVTVGTAFYLLRMVMPTHDPGSLKEIWRIYFFSYAHFWYLQALLLVFLAVVVLERLRLMSTVLAWASCWLGSIALLLLFPLHIELFSFAKALYLLPFFIFGVGFQRFPDLARDRRSVTVAVALLITGMIWQQLGWYGVLAALPRPASPAGLAVGSAASLLLFRFRPTVRPLVALGGYAYGIYLLHIFGTAGSRIGLAKLGVFEPTVVFFVGLTLGVVMPIAMEIVASRFSWARFLMLGQRLGPHQRTT